MIDSHCHFDLSQFDDDRLQVLLRCQQLGVSDIVIPGTQRRSWQQQISLCQQHPSLHFALGLHPYFIQHADSEDLSQLDQLLSQHRSEVVALGEIGLDYHEVEEDDKRWQLDCFVSQLEIAQQHKLPVIVHHRQSHNDIIRHLKQLNFAHGGVIHAFSGSHQQAKTYLDLGFVLGVGGTITYQRAQKTRDTIKQLPLDTLLLETDAPDMPICGRQGKRNSPEYLPEIADHLAKLKGVAVEEVVAQTRANTVQLFRLT